jgi:hypothetical protein
MNARYPELEQGAEAMEGTAAHWVFEEMLFNRPIAEGMVAPNGVSVTEEMLEGGEVYAAAVSEAYQSLASVSHYFIERRVMIPRVHENNWGTPDTWIFGHNPTSGRAKLVVLDYKFGHEFVEVFENWQLVDYTCGLLDELGIDGIADQLTDVEFVVVQPRSYHRDGPVRTWRTTASNLRGHFNKLRGAAEAAHMPKPIATPSAACKHCPGRHACEALQRSAYEAADMAFHSAPHEMSPEAAGLELRMLLRAQARLAARISGHSEQIEHVLRTGGRNPYFQLEQTLGRLGWARPVQEILELGKLCGADLSKPQAITPTQAKKLIDPALVDLYSERGNAGLKLEPANNSQARKVFGN